MTPERMTLGCGENEPGSGLQPASGRRFVLFALSIYAALLVGGQWISTHLEAYLLLHGPSQENPEMTGVIIGTICIYIVATALPFVPGAEIGMSLILFFGVHIVPVVYLATVVSLFLAFVAGRHVPERRLALLFKTLGLHRASSLLCDLSDLDQSDRVVFLVRNTPPGWLPWLVRHRFWALIVIINLPGNTLLGGGGGIAMLVGMCRIMPLPKFTLCIMLAVCPIPLGIILTSFMFQ